MRTHGLLLFWLILPYPFFGQSSDNSLKMISEYSSTHSEIKDILQFEGIDYYKVKFIDSDLSDKSYHLSVKEIWDGKIVSDSTIVNSKDLPFQQYRQINDTVLDIRIVSKYSNNKTLKIMFNFPRFSIEREFRATESNYYSLRNIVEERLQKLEYNKTFYWLAYILPYEREDGSKSWCDVESDVVDIENWGEKFGIEHYLLFEMKFE